MLTSQKLPDIFRSTGQPVIGGDCNNHRSPVPQVTFYSHGYRRVSNGVSKLCQCIAGAGCNNQCIKQLFGANWFHAFDGL